MIKFSVHNEFSRLRKVILGIGDDFGGCPDIEDAYDPRSKEHILANTFPLEKGYVVEQVKFSEISKMGGLFRCATLPLIRDHE